MGASAAAAALPCPDWVVLSASLAAVPSPSGISGDAGGADADADVRSGSSGAPDAGTLDSVAAGALMAAASPGASNDRSPSCAVAPADGGVEFSEADTLASADACAGSPRSPISGSSTMRISPVPSPAFALPALAAAGTAPGL